MKNLFFALSAFVVIGLSSCGGVDCADTVDLATRLTDAGTAYGADASEDNCKDYKAVLEESLDYSDCDGATPEATAATQALIDSLDC